MINAGQIKIIVHEPNPESGKDFEGHSNFITDYSGFDANRLWQLQ
jgi:hypothetical protein